jgi:hypothetical protein
VNLVTALLTNGAYGYPRGAARRRKPVILACLHQTANRATAMQERNYANRAHSTGPSATAYIDKDGSIVRAILPGRYAAWSHGDVDPWGSETRIRSRGEAVVLVDESAEQVPAANIARADLDRLCGRCERWSEAEGAMGPAAVVVLGVDPEGSIEMPPPLDERPVEALGPHRLDHPFRVGVGVRSPDRGADDPHSL